MANRTLQSPFAVDQGALCLTEDAEAEFVRDPGALVRGIVAVAEQELYVGTKAAAKLCEYAQFFGAAPAVARGAALLDLLMCERPAEAIDLAVRVGVVGQILPDLDRLRAMPRRHGLYKDAYTHTLRVVAATPADSISRLAALLHDIAKPDTLVIQDDQAHFPNHDLVGADHAARRLRGLGFDEGAIAAVETLVRLHLRANSYEPNWTDSAVRRLHLDAGEQWQRLLDLSFADVTSARSEAVTRARRRVAALAEHAASLDRPVDLCPLDGNELMDGLGRGPGRWIGLVKQLLTQQVHDGVLNPDDKQAAWRAVTAFLEQPAEDGSAR